ncbi:MAG: hypothetical protein ABIQ70_06470 [Dokdonella sp.]
MNTRTTEIQSIVSSYIDAAKSYGEALKKGDHKSANDAHSVIRSAFLKLSDLGSGEAVLSLLGDENLAVRYSAAVDALSFSSREAESVLEGVVSGPASPIRLMAQISLSEWRKHKQVKSQ